MRTQRLEGALQVSGGHLKDAEAGHDGGPRVDVNRVTASATYQRPSVSAASGRAPSDGVVIRSPETMRRTPFSPRQTSRSTSATPGSGASSCRASLATISRSNRPVSSPSRNSRAGTRDMSKPGTAASRVLVPECQRTASPTLWSRSTGIGSTSDSRCSSRFVRPSTGC